MTSGHLAEKNKTKQKKQWGEIWTLNREKADSGMRSGHLKERENGSWDDVWTLNREKNR